jgi:hypothetical protein
MRGRYLYCTKMFAPPFFHAQKYLTPLIFPQPPPPPSPVINDRSLMAAWVCAMCYTFQANAPAYKRTRPWVRGCKRTSVLPNLVPWACDPREGTWGSGIIRWGRNLIGRWYGMRSSILARIPGFRQRIIPEPHVPSRGSQARGTRLRFAIRPVYTCNFCCDF